MRGFKKAVEVATPLPEAKIGYFNLKKARNSSLKRVTSKVKIAMNRFNISIAVSFCGIPPLFQKINQKKTRLFLKRRVIPQKVLTFFTDCYYRLKKIVAKNYKYHIKGL